MIPEKSRENIAHSHRFLEKQQMLQLPEIGGNKLQRFSNEL
jgi:hypothetical protein